MYNIFHEVQTMSGQGPSGLMKYLDFWDLGAVCWDKIILAPSPGK